MKKLVQIAVVAAAAILLGTAARADVTLNSIRVAAKDTDALAKFYKAAFGMEEVNRIQGGGGPGDLPELRQRPWTPPRPTRDCRSCSCTAIRMT